MPKFIVSEGFALFNAGRVREGGSEVELEAAEGERLAAEGVVTPADTAAKPSKGKGKAAQADAEPAAE